jgi:DNA-binding transcriptional ArsR family regulator
MAEELKYHRLNQNAAATAQLFAALASAERLRILFHRASRVDAVSELVPVIDVSQSVLSRHLARLRPQRLVTTRREGKLIYNSIHSVHVDAMLHLLSTLDDSLTQVTAFYQKTDFDGDPESPVSTRVPHRI